MTKWPVQKPKDRTTQKHADIQKKAIFGVFRIFLFLKKRPKGNNMSRSLCSFFAL